MGIETAILGSAIIGGASSLIGGSSQASAAGKAADAQSRAAIEGALIQERSADKALALQKEIFDIQRGDFAPWRTAGVNALDELSNLSGFNGSVSQEQARARFQSDPGFDFMRAEGIKSLDRSALARGGMRSGAHEKAIMRYGTGIASQSYGDYYNRLASLAGVGQSATNAMSGAAQNYGAGGSNALMAAGNAAAGGIVGAGNARASGYTNAGNAWANTAGGIATSANQGIQNYMLGNALGGFGGGSFNSATVPVPVGMIPFKSGFA